MLKEITKEELNEILKEHSRWLRDKSNGVQADLRSTYLGFADLGRVNLRNANLTYADLHDANLEYADLRGTDLRHSNMRHTNLTNTLLTNADLEDVNLDYSAFPLWSGGLNVHISDRIAIQLLYHLIQNVQYSKNISKEVKEKICTPELIELANHCHRIDSYGKLVVEE